MAEIKDFPKQEVDVNKSFLEVCDILAKEAVEGYGLTALDFIRNEYMVTIVIRRTDWDKK